MAKLDAEIADLEKDVAEDSFFETKAGRKEDEEKLAALKKRRDEMVQTSKGLEADMVIAAGPEGQAAGAQALGDAAAMEAAMSGGGGMEDALASIVENQAQQTKAIVAALAKIDAKASSGGGGNGIPMMIPGGDSSSQGGLGRKTVIGAPIS